MHIRRASDRDADAIWQIFQRVVAGRDTYTFAPATPRHIGVGYWFGDDVTSFVVEESGQVMGMFKVVANNRKLGAHVSNASFMVDPAAAGRGIGRAMGRHALEEARRQGYEAMQFNFVVSTNRRAVALWQGLGFRIVGTLPKAFQHGVLGLVDAYVMHRFLDDIVPAFGAAPATPAVVRPCAYAVIANDRGELAVVEAEEGNLLPGGGVDTDETPDAAVIREVEEECALHIEIRRSLGDAVQFVQSTRTGTSLEKRSHFVVGDVVGHVDRPPEHYTRWLGADAALQVVSYESHAWAIRRWARFNT